MNQTHLIFVLYDSVTNSVFKGQILQPLFNRLKNDPHLLVTLVTFERSSFAAQAIGNYCPAHECLTVHVLRQVPFIGTPSIRYAALQLRTILHSMHNTYTIIARGPLAGLICSKVITTQCTQLTIQARGLLTEEYDYVHRTAKTPAHRFIHNFRSWQFRRLEHKVYSMHDARITYESVSEALSHFLVQTYGASPGTIRLAHQDIPMPLDEQQIMQWRAQSRQQLAIASDATVYCYNGSAKAWQCPDMVIAYFLQQIQKQPNCFLLILSQDTALFEQLLAATSLPSNCYVVLSVAHTDIYRYLAAADVGLLFREKNILNWISRPTKILEYKAVGLSIVHNHTVAWLTEDTGI